MLNQSGTEMIDEQAIDLEVLLEHLAWCALDHDCHEAALELSSN